MGDIKALNAQSIELLLGQIQRLGQGAGALLLGALFRQQTRQLQGRALLGQLQPDAPLATRLGGGENFAARLRTQGL